MGAQTTVVFADLTGSTSLFEAVGNAAATKVVTALTQWICAVCEACGGRVVKTLGDGVLAVFQSGPEAVAAAVRMQRELEEQCAGIASRMHLKVGMACGEIVEVDGDCYGDAVNVASRLSDLSGSEQIWASETVIDQIDHPPPGARIRGLGPVPIRGKSEPLVAFSVEWQEDMATNMMTLPAGLSILSTKRASATAVVALTCLDESAAFASDEMPVHLGRAAEAEFVVTDPRVSRIHARISWSNGSFMLADLSTYGTWLRFDGSQTIVPLRRSDCVLHGSGDIALGANFDDFTVPVIHFDIKNG